MNPARPDDRTPDEILAEDLVDEALRTMQIPAELLPVIRVGLIGEMLTTLGGQRMLRRIAPDQAVSSSGELL